MCRAYGNVLRQCPLSRYPTHSNRYRRPKRTRVFPRPICPCGSCRQALLESEIRYKKKIEVILYGTQEIYLIDSIADMLPFCFRIARLKSKYPITQTKYVGYEKKQQYTLEFLLPDNFVSALWRWRILPLDTSQIIRRQGRIHRIQHHSFLEWGVQKQKADIVIFKPQEYIRFHSGRSGTPRDILSSVYLKMNLPVRSHSLLLDFSSSPRPDDDKQLCTATQVISVEYSAYKFITQTVYPTDQLSKQYAHFIQVLTTQENF